MIRALVFDWGDTVMQVFPEYSGPMAHWPRVEAVPGIENALREAKKSYVTALASNACDSGSSLVRDALERAGLEKYFDEVFTARDLNAAKPDSAFYRGILYNLKLAPDEVVMIGDQFETDIAGAKKTGFWTIWYNPSDREPPIGLEGMADVVIQRHSDMENALMLISGRASKTKS